MNKRSLIIVLLMLALTSLVFSQKGLNENIDRGVVALTIDGNHAYIGWRLLITDPPDISFNVYRKQAGFGDFQKINKESINSTTDFIDETVMPGNAYRYRIKAIINNKEVETPGEATVFMLTSNQPYYSIMLKTKAQLKRIGIGDLNGDGAYDFVIQSPDFNVDPYYMPGYWKRSPEPYMLDAYTSKGQFLWSYDMGWSIETGTWYSPYMVYDIDGDGLAEVYAKAGEGDPRELDGHVLEGPEYLVKIDGLTGKIINKTDWLSKDGFLGNYNYWSRNFLTVAYLNGLTPSLIMQRGTYTIIKTIALNKNMEKEWYWESTGEYEKYKGQGQHGIMQGDVDFDGKDELIIGTFALDHDGKPIWYTGLKHNDVGYLADIDPSRPGMEIFYGIESRSPKNGVCLVDAATGEIIWGFEGKTTHVHGQGMVGDIDPDYPGMECYAGEAKGGDQYFLYNAGGKRLSDKDMGSLNPRPVWWDADDLKELNINNLLLKYKGDTLMKIEGKVVMVGDLIGDWREEIVTSLPGELRIYSTNIPAADKKVCLLQNRQYRLGLANSTMGYFYPPQLGLLKR
ncbi:MAG TPA: silent information regulator protein Sir2 [Bacteroidales bacterium]|nr:silent information regulator protein Sir2 [Bacteroidales bacterium]